jgi:Protein of unknown function (DUF5818)
MSSLHGKYFFLFSLFLLLFGCLTVQAQDNMSKNMANSVTGCLQKGVEDGGFTVTDADGKMWELSGKVDATHVGHTVTVKGHVLQRTKMEEAKYAENERQESKGKPYTDFQVSSLKMVSDSCK